MTTNEPNPWAALSRTLFTGAPLEDASAAPAAAAATAAPPAPAPTAEADPFRDWVNDTEQQQAKATVVESIAAAHNVPAAALVGETPEELTTHAQAISAMMHPTDAPVVLGGEKQPNMNPGMGSEMRAMLNLMSAPHLRG